MASSYIGQIGGGTVTSTGPFIVWFPTRESLEFQTIEEAQGFLNFYHQNPRARASKPGKIYRFTNNAWTEDAGRNDEPATTSIAHSTRKIRLLLADDSADDRFLMKRAMQRSALLDVVACLEDGEEVIAYVSGQGAYRDRQQYPLPELLVLDIKMPRKTGFDVLTWVQTQKLQIPCVMLSSSMLNDDRERAMQLGAKAYLPKGGEGLTYRDSVLELETLMMSWGAAGIVRTEPRPVVNG